MAHYEGQASINNNRTTHIQEILENIILRIAENPLVNDPPVMDKQGNPIRITMITDQDGIVLENQTGLTLAIYPYTYTKTADEALTTGSNNASVVYKPYSLGNAGTPMGPLDEVTAYIGFKLHLLGYSTTTGIDENAIQRQQTVFKLNESEQTLRRWMEVIRLILVTDLRKLAAVTGEPRFLLSNSYVKWINFNSGNWEKDGNLIFHTATLLWEVKYYATRIRDDVSLIDIIGGEVGTIPDGAGEITVGYDLSNDRYYNVATNETIPLSDLIDPTTGTLYLSLRVNVIKLIDMVSSSRDDFTTISDVPGA